MSDLSLRDEEIRKAAFSMIDLCFPIFKHLATGKLEHVGTGFFLSFESRIFLVTAQHCVRYIIESNDDKNKKGRIVLGFDGRIFSIDKTVKFIYTNESATIPEHVLDISTLEITSDFEFLESARKIAIPENRIAENGLSSRSVTVMGYRNRNNRNTITKDEHDKSKVQAQPTAYIEYPLLSEFDMSSLGCIPKRQSAIHWPNRDTSKQGIGIPRGVSGAPVWSFAEPTNPETGVVVGLFIKYFADKNVAVFTDIGQVEAFIKQLYGV